MELEHAVHLVFACCGWLVFLHRPRYIIKRTTTNMKLPTKDMSPQKSDAIHHLYWEESKAPDIGPPSNPPKAVKAKHIPNRAPSSDKSGVNIVTSGTISEM